MGKKYFYKSENQVHKIWNIELKNNSYEIEEGTVGSKLIKINKEFIINDEVKDAYNEEIQSHLKLEYMEIPEERFLQYEQILNLMAHFDEIELARKAFAPEVYDEEGSITDSKYGGLPYLHNNEEWPICESCNEPLSLIVQINMEYIPKEIKNYIEIDSGLIQLFYCTNEDIECGCCPQEPNEEKIQLVRFIESDKINKDTDIKVPENMRFFPEALIDGWQDIGYEYPYEGTKQLGDLSLLKLSDEKKYTNKIPEKLISFLEGRREENSDRLEVGLKPDDFGIYNDFLLTNFTRDRDKIGGWPYWVQSSYYPPCPECGNEMSYLIQVDCSYLPFDFWGENIGHIYICKKHRNQVDFDWQFT
jgi:uncharacterized protein YwqG